MRGAERTRPPSTIATSQKSRMHIQRNPSSQSNEGNPAAGQDPGLQAAVSCPESQRRGAQPSGVQRVGVARPGASNTARPGTARGGLAEPHRTAGRERDPQPFTSKDLGAFAAVFVVPSATRVSVTDCQNGRHARGGIRTRKPLRAMDFESTA